MKIGATLTLSLPLSLGFSRSCVPLKTFGVLYDTGH
jgi:hypothetical protein